MRTLPELLASVGSLVGTPAPFTPDNAPEHPRDLFVDWFAAAIAAGVAEPHAMTLSTVDAEGLPDARVLILKGVTEDGAWTFAGSEQSTKGVQLGARPVAALTFHWKEQIRSIRVRGTVTQVPAPAARRDFLARGLAARTVALSAQQSSQLTDPGGFTRALSVARQQLEEEPETVPEVWRVWQVVPASVEFWQGQPDRNHLRLQYVRSGSGWERHRLQP
ncbi:pyridoxine/pyridoxamine 5'-phosphate oxidase [Arthrobacter rhombi]|uniref:pyridoxine/pyridoxamine 5'-phosphate oxidase n=1 Tax=Arthrobacter rhombi TaxID=71253 RepID=UPI003F938852